VENVSPDLTPRLFIWWNCPFIPDLLHCRKFPLVIPATSPLFGGLLGGAR